MTQQWQSNMEKEGEYRTINQRIDGGTDCESDLTSTLDHHELMKLRQGKNLDKKSAG